MAVSDNTFTKKASYPNQRVVKIVNEQTKQPFAQFNIDILNKAAKDLIPVYPAAFEVWIYLSKNQTGFEAVLSPEIITEDFGISVDRYQRGFNTLKEKGYLEQVSKTLFIFHQMPNDKYKPKDIKSCHEVKGSTTAVKSCLKKQDNPVDNNLKIQSTKAGISGKTIIQDNTDNTQIIQQQQHEVSSSDILDGYRLTDRTVEYNAAICVINGDSKRFDIVGDYFYDKERMEASRVKRFIFPQG